MIEVGEYIRTPYHKIEKIKKIKQEDGWICVITDKNAYELEWLKTDKVKHSKNIIDLIEVGDYVNGYKVISIDINSPNDCKECIELDRNNTYEYQWISRNEIKTILTKELYQANCYTVLKKDTRRNS